MQATRLPLRQTYFGATGFFDSSTSCSKCGAARSKGNSTGRFFGAAGHFTLGGQLDFNTGSFVLPWQGIISSVGLSKKP